MYAVLAKMMPPPIHVHVSGTSANTNQPSTAAQIRRAKSIGNTAEPTAQARRRSRTRLRGEHQ
jgi:hypothetical protein